MRYSTELPEGFKSWYAFYLHVKPTIAEGRETVVWKDETKVSGSYIKIKEYVVQFIKDQALEELAELRQIQFFNFEELRYLRFALQTSMSFSGAIDPKIKTLELKVDELMYRERHKQREG